MSLPSRETHLETLGTVVQEEIVVTCLGMATHLWNRIRPKPSNFHLADSMGQAIPLAAGLALARLQSRTIVMEGDGGLLMNLGCLATVADLELDNLLILLFDNRVYEASGNQPLPGRTADFTALAGAAGIPHCATIERAEDFRPALDEGLGRKAVTFLTLKIRPESNLNFPPYKDRPWEVAERFRNWIDERKTQA